MRLARLASFIAALLLAPIASRAEEAPSFRWDGIWAGIGASAASTDLSLPGPQPFFANAGLTGPDSTTARGVSLDLSLSRLWQRKSVVFGIEASASRGGADFADPWPGRILADVTLFQTICTDCTHLLVNGSVTATSSLRGLLGTVGADGTLWFASLGLTRSRANLSALGGFESRPPNVAGLLAFAPMDLSLHGVSFGVGLSRPLGPRSTIRMEVLQDRLTGATPGFLAPALGPDLKLRTTRLAVSYQLRF